MQRNQFKAFQGKVTSSIIRIGLCSSKKSNSAFDLSSIVPANTRALQLIGPKLSFDLGTSIMNWCATRTLKATTELEPGLAAWRLEQALCRSAAEYLLVQTHWNELCRHHETHLTLQRIFMQVAQSLPTACPKIEILLRHGSTSHTEEVV